MLIAGDMGGLKTDLARKPTDAREGYFRRLQNLTQVSNPAA